MSQLSCWLLTVYTRKYATSLCTQKSVGGLFGRFIDKRARKSGNAHRCAYLYPVVWANVRPIPYILYLALAQQLVNQRPVVSSLLVALLLQPFDRRIFRSYL